MIVTVEKQMKKDCKGRRRRKRKRRKHKKMAENKPDHCLSNPFDMEPLAASCGISTSPGSMKQIACETLYYLGRFARNSR